jgi:hypothetical protein
MLQVLSKSQESIASAYSLGSTAVDVKQAKTINVLAGVTVTTPSAGTFTALASTDVLTKVAHGGLTGQKAQVSNSGGALPAGLSAATDYFMIKIDADTFYLASSLVNAVAGTRIDITTNGTGTQTVTPTALAGASVKLQACLDDVISASSVFFDVPICGTGDASKSQSITATANLSVSDIDPTYNFVRAYYTLTAGQLSISQSILVKGNV